MSISLPRSISNPFVSASGVVGFLTALCYCRTYGLGGVEATVLSVLAYGASITLVEMLTISPADARNGLDFRRWQFSLPRSFFKLAGLAASFGCVGFFYWLFPEYHFNFWNNEEGGGYYAPYSDGLLIVAPALAVIAVPYIVGVDAVMKQPLDSYYWLGRRLLGRSSELGIKGILQHCLGWMIRGYLLALFANYANENVNLLINYPAESVQGMLGIYHAANAFMLAMVPVLVLSANIFTLRLMGTHIRSVDPTMFGWWVCLVCFQPFKSVLDHYIWFPQGEVWINALQATPELQALWAGLLIVLIAAWLTADVNLGNRYGQLSHRGIVTGGLYRFTKHPSYILTMLFLTVSYMPPLIYHSWTMVGHGMVALGFMSWVYLMRARFEERHLSNDPDYVAYAMWINQNGIFRVLGRRIPGLRYSPPKKESLALGTAYTGLAYT